MLMLKYLCSKNLFNGHQFNSLQSTRLFSLQIKPTSFTKYLVESLGFTHQQSLATSSKLQHSRGCKKVSEFNFAENADSVINFFTQQGLDQAQIIKIVSYEPRFLISNVDKTLIPKFKALQEQGFSGSDVAHIVAANPRILFTNLDITLPAIRKLREILGCDCIVSVYKRPCWYMNSCVLRHLVPNVALLRSYGIPIELIRKRVISHPSPFLRSPRVFEEAVIGVEKELGIPRSSKQFLAGVNLLAACNEKTILLKIEAYKSFGWMDDEVRDLCRHNPNCLSLSVVAIKKKLGFFMKEMGYGADFLKRRPALLTYSLEKRIVPRYRLLEVLRERGLLMSGNAVYNSFGMPEDRFVEKFVLPFEDVHDVYSELTGLPLKLPTKEGQKATEPLTQLTNVA